MITDEPFYETSDLGAAAFLVALGTPLLATKPAEGRRRIFCFPLSARMTASQYLQNAPVPARAFFNSVRDLKALVHEREI